MKRFTVLLMILGMVSVSQAGMLADFETGLDGFSVHSTPASTLGTSTKAGAVTSGSQCLKVTHNPTNYWPIRWTPSTIPTKLGKLQFDLTCFASEWPTHPWTRFCEKIAVHSNVGAGGWSEYSTTTANWIDRTTGASCPVDWDAEYYGDIFRTCTIDISNFAYLTGATEFYIVFSFNCGTAGPYYIDNMHFVDEPYNPNPANGGIGIVGATNTLSWHNAIDTLEYAQAWFGEVVVPPTDPNYPSLQNYKTKLTMISKIANPGATSSAAIPAIVDGKKYAWIVEGFYGCGDPNNNTEPNYPGLIWTFTATTNNPPVANAGADQYIYDYADVNDIVITLNGSATDDGKISPLTYTWTQTAGPLAIITDPNAAITTVNLLGGLANLTEAGSAVPYVFQLVANDGQFTGSDTVTVFVNTNSCTASIEAGSFYFYGDIASATTAGVPDCKVDLYDFAELALNWLGCSDTFEGCD